MAGTLQDTITHTLEASFFGFMAATILYGVTCLQTLIYWLHRHDGPLFEWMIIFLWVLDTLHFACIVHAVFHYVIKNWGNPLALLIVTWSLPTIALLSTLLEFTCRCINIARFWKLSGRHKLSTAILVILNLYLFGVGMMFVVHAYEIKTLGDLPGLSWMIYLGFASAFVVDTAITAALSVVLWRSARTSDRSSYILKPLLRYLLLSGSVTSVTSLALLVVFTHNPHGFGFIALYFVLCEALLAPLLASLNLRGALRAAAASASDLLPSSGGARERSRMRVLGRSATRGGPGGGAAPRRAQDGLVVHITQSRMQTVDFGGDITKDLEEGSEDGHSQKSPLPETPVGQAY